MATNNNYTQIIPSLNLNSTDIMSSTSSQTSISNFVAQTPKDNQLQHFKFNQFINNRAFQKTQQNQKQEKKLIYQNKQNDAKQGNKVMGVLPYKMIKSQLPANCINHPDKESTYFIESQNKQIIYYCQKCAILVASQGFHVEKIINNVHKQQYSQENNQNAKISVRFSLKDTKTVVKKSKFINDALKKQVKQKQLTTFLNRLERTQSRVEKILQLNEKQLQGIDNAVQKSINQMKNIFDRLHKVLHNFQENYLDQINRKNNQSRQVLQQKCQQMIKDIQNLQQMKQDICEVYDDVINFTTNNQFEFVMNAYNQNIREIQLNLEQNQTNKMMPINSARIKRDYNVEILGPDIITELQKQFDNHLSPAKRVSTRSVTRRMSLMNGPNPAFKLR